MEKYALNASCVTVDHHVDGTTVHQDRLCWLVCDPLRTMCVLCPGSACEIQSIDPEILRLPCVGLPDRHAFRLRLPKHRMIDKRTASDACSYHTLIFSSRPTLGNLLAKISSFYNEIVTSDELQDTVSSELPTISEYTDEVLQSCVPLFSDVFGYYKRARLRSRMCAQTCKRWELMGLIVDGQPWGALLYNGVSRIKDNVYRLELHCVTPYARFKGFTSQPCKCRV